MNNGRCQSMNSQRGRMIIEWNESYMFPRIFQVLVIHSRRDKPRPGEEAETGLRLIELPGQQAIEAAFDKLGSHALW